MKRLLQRPVKRRPKGCLKGCLTGRLTGFGQWAPGGRRSAGFTLIEVLVALSIVAYALIGLVGLINRNLGVVGRDQDLTRGMLLARKFIAEMEVREKFPELGFSSGEFDEYPGFYWEREVTELFLPEVRQVVVRIVFDERQPDAVELLYYIRDRRVPEELDP